MGQDLLQQLSDHRCGARCQERFCCCAYILPAASIPSYSVLQEIQDCFEAIQGGCAHRPLLCLHRVCVEEMVEHEVQGHSPPVLRAAPNLTVHPFHQDRPFGTECLRVQTGDVLPCLVHQFLPDVPCLLIVRTLHLPGAASFFPCRLKSLGGGYCWRCRSWKWCWRHWGWRRHRG